jgi:hypothetical protein
MRMKNPRSRKADGPADKNRSPDLSHAAGRRRRIRELCELHDHVTVGEIVQDMDRSVETDRPTILGTLLDLEREGYIYVLEADDPSDREVKLA